MNPARRVLVLAMVFAATGCDRRPAPVASNRPAVATPATGEWIAGQIETRIDSKSFHDPVAIRRAVQVTVANGVVTLRGEVGSEDEQRTVEQIAAETPGVVGVRNELHVRADDRPTVRRDGT